MNRSAVLELCPITLRQAQAFIAEHHRHNKPPRGWKFGIGVREKEGDLVGVATAGRPVARAFDDGLTLEVNRTCTNGAPNANSMLYGAVWRAAKAMGYRRCITYTQADETGASLRAVGWRRVAERPARASWADSSVKLRALRESCWKRQRGPRFVGNPPMIAHRFEHQKALACRDELARLAKEAAPLLLCSEETVRLALEQALTAPLTEDALERVHTRQETGL